MSQERKSSTDQKLEARLALLEELFVRFAQTGTVENTLGQGLDAVSGHLGTLGERLENIAAELAPLRRLSGPSSPLDARARADLDAILAAHARAEFKNVSALTSNDGGPRYDSAPRRPAGAVAQRPNQRSTAS